MSDDYMGDDNAPDPNEGPTTFKAPAGPAPSALTRCRDCDAETPMLFTRGGNPQRVICGVCEGKANRKVTDRLAWAVKTLKTSDDEMAEREAFEILRSTLGREKADELTTYIANARAEGKYEGRSRSRSREGYRRAA